MKKYSIIYADFPWKYNSKAHHKSKFRGGAIGHYDLMSMKDIKQFPLDKLAADNCVLFMWCTFPMLNEQIKLFEHWGFKYKTLGFSWIKTNKHNGKPFTGVGFYARSNAEICLMGMKGNIKPISHKVSSCVISPREEHSKKPDEVRDRIVQLFGNLPRIELFARQKYPGWDAYGNEVESDIIL